MKIAYVSTYLPTECGIATYTDYLIRGIMAVDPIVDIKVVAENGALSIKKNKFEVIPCWSRDEDYVEPIIKHTKDSDVIHIQHEYKIYKFDDRLPSVLKRIGTRAKKVITIHCVIPTHFSERGAIDETYISDIAQLADEVVVHIHQQKSILARLGIPLKKIHVIPHGTEISNEDKEASRKKLGLPIEEKILLLFGLIKKHKGIHTALDALVEILKERKDVHLLIVGALSQRASKADRNYEESVRKKIVKLNLTENVIYWGNFFPEEDIPYLFGAVDIVLFTYYEENCAASGAFHMAIGAKKPVIASRIPKFDELTEICDELLVLPYNSSGIAVTALRLLEDQKFNNYVVKKIDKFREKTSWRVVAGKHLELYKRKKVSRSYSETGKD